MIPKICQDIPRTKKQIGIPNKINKKKIRKLTVRKEKREGKKSVN